MKFEAIDHKIKQTISLINFIIKTHKPRAKIYSKVYSLSIVIAKLYVLKYQSFLILLTHFCLFFSAQNIERK